MVDGVESWKDYALNKIKAGATGGYGAQLYEDECERLKMAILKKYEEINDFYLAELEKVKIHILEIFQEFTGSFISIPDEGVEMRGTKAVANVISKLKSHHTALPRLEAAFEWLNKIQIDFRQSVYPFLLKTWAFKSMEAKQNPLDTEVIRDKSQEEIVAYIGEKLKVNGIEVNFRVADAISESNATAYFMYSIMEHFDDLVFRAEPEKVTYDLQEFVENFPQEILPELFSGNDVNAQWKKMQQELQGIKEVIDGILED